MLLYLATLIPWESPATGQGWWKPALGKDLHAFLCFNPFLSSQAQRASECASAVGSIVFITIFIWVFPSLLSGSSYCKAMVKSCYSVVFGKKFTICMVFVDTSHSGSEQLLGTHRLPPQLHCVLWQLQGPHSPPGLRETLHFSENYWLCSTFGGCVNIRII